MCMCMCMCMYEWQMSNALDKANRGDS
jgi:hypothetical protein